MNCPLCSGNDIQFQKTFITEEIQRHWIDQFHIDISSDLDIEEFGLYLCRSCNFQFFLPTTNVGSSELYSELEKLDWYYMPNKWEHDMAINDLQECSKILEVGCGFGAFVQRLIKEKQVDVEGIELNISAVEKAKEIGIPVNHLDLLELANQRESSYDAVCSFQVLEHVSNPSNFLGACCKLLKPNGKLILGLPNANSFLRYQENILDLPPHHLSRWSEDTLKALPQFLPIKLLHIKNEPLQDYHIKSYVRTYLRLFSSHSHLGMLTNQKIESTIVRFITKCGLNRWMRGQSLYVCYERH